MLYLLLPSQNKQLTTPSTPRLPCTQQTRRQGGHRAGPTEVLFLPLRGHVYCQPFHRADASVFALLGDDAHEGRRAPSYSRNRAHDSHHLLLSVPSRDPEIFREQLGQGTSIIQEKMKKTAGLTTAKRWGDFQLQALRRKKAWPSPRRSTFAWLLSPACIKPREGK